MTTTEIDLSAKKVNLRMTRGDTWSILLRRWTGTDTDKTYTDLTGWTATAQVRTSADAEDVTVELAVEIADPQTGDDLGAFTVSLNGMMTGSLTGTSYVWDVQLVDTDGGIHTPFGGTLRVVADTTR